MLLFPGRLRPLSPRLTRARVLLLASLGLIPTAPLAAAPEVPSGLGVCTSNPPISSTACFDAIQSAGLVVNDIFRDVDGRAAPDLVIFGQLFNNWPGCATANFGGCSGQSTPPYDCPGQYVCTGAAGTFVNAGAYANTLDRLWWQPCRLLNHVVVGSCPDWTCVADGTGGNYLPWEGLVFDLGAYSNRVALFGALVTGPEPCHSLTFTVYLTDNPASQVLVQHPEIDGVDPTKWNRAVLTRLFTKGMVEIRPPDPAGHAACGDTANYSVEMDSMAQVFSLPAGAVLRYAAVVAGNDGLDFPPCSFDTNIAELDAVAGMTEGGAGVCPDLDFDGFPDCNCPTAPPACDCNDNDPNITVCSQVPVFADGFESGNPSAWSVVHP